MAHGTWSSPFNKSQFLISEVTQAYKKQTIFLFPLHLMLCNATFQCTSASVLASVKTD